MHTYTTRVDKGSKETILVKDGRDVICHKLAPVPVQTAMGVGMSRISCGTNCGRAVLDTNVAGAPCFKQTCEAERVSFDLEQQTEEGKDKPKGTIISL